MDLPVQTKESNCERVLRSLRQTLGRKREECQQSHGKPALRKDSRLRYQMACIAIAACTTAVQSCTALDIASGRTIQCTASSDTGFNSAFGRFATSDIRRIATDPSLDSAAIYAECTDAQCFRNFFTGISVSSCTEFRDNRSRSFSRHCTSACSSHSPRGSETAAGHLCPEQVCNATSSGKGFDRSTQHEKHAIQAASCRGQQVGKGREAHQHASAHHPTKLGAMAQICPTGQGETPVRSSSLPSGSSQFRAGIVASQRRSAATATLDFRPSETDVHHFPATRNPSRSSNEYGSRWNCISPAMECPSDSFQPRSTAIAADDASRSTEHSHARSRFPATGRNFILWGSLCRVLYRSHAQWISSPSPTWIFPRGSQWICPWISGPTGFSPCRSCSGTFCSTSCAASSRFRPNKCASFASQLLRELAASPTRSSTEDSSAFDCFFGFATRCMDFTSENASDFFHGHPSSCARWQSSRDRSSSFNWESISTTIAAGATSILERHFTDDGTIQAPVWHCQERARTGSSSSDFCQSRPNASGCCPAFGNCDSHAAKPQCFTDGARPDDPSRSSGQRVAVTMQGVLSPMADLSTWPPIPERSNGHHNHERASPSPNRDSSSMPISSASGDRRMHQHSRLTTVTRGSFHSQGEQVPTWKCPRSTDRRGGPQFQLFRVEEPRPLVTMHKEAVDAAHGIFGPSLDFVELSQHGLTECNSPCSDPVTLRLDELLVPTQRKAKQFWTLREVVSAAQEPWPTSFLWNDLQLAVELLPDLSDDLRTFFLSCPSWRGEEVRVAHLFTDGSASLHTPAAWSLVIVLECTMSSSEDTCYRFLGFAGSVLHSLASWVQHDASVGETIADAMSAELAGIVWALGWALQFPSAVEFCFHYDNLSAGHGAFGHWNPPKGSAYSQLVKSVTCLRQLLASRAVCSGHHIKAHAGAPWNELADAVAKALAKGILQPSPLPSCLPLLLHHPMLEHAWTELAVHSESDLRSCCEWPSIFRREGPLNPLSADTFWQPLTFVDTQPSTQRPVHVNLRIGTANVLTLDCGAQSFQRTGRLLLGRIGFLRSQFEPLELHIVGLQETRSHGHVTRHNQAWWVFQSGCTEVGTHGIEIWISKQTPYGFSGSKLLMFLQQHFTVLAFHPRYLLLEVNAPSLQVHILCLHSPFAKSAATDPEQFWQEIDRVLDRLSNGHWPLITLGDFNAKLGSVQTAAVSCHDAELESELGTYMHKFMLSRSLCAPSTFAACHSSSSATWKVDTKAASRIDYILVPQTWLDSVTASQVHLDVDLLTEHDHQLVSLSVQLRLKDSQPRAQRPPRPCPRSLQDPNRVKAFLNDVEALEAFPWTLGVGQHCEALTMQLQKLSRRHFAPDEPQPLQRHFSDSTWNLVTIRHKLLRTIRNLDTLMRRTAGLLHLRAWFRQYAFCTGHATTEASLDFQAILTLRSQAFLLKLDMIALRKQLQQPARQSSRQDRIRELKSIAERFVNSASLSDTQQMHRCLKPLLGPHGRKAVLSAKPLPAVRTADGSLAQGGTELATVWQQHFAAIEGGQPTTPQQLQAQVHAFSLAVSPHVTQLPLDLDALPTLAQVEAVIRRSKAGKAPGPDSLPAAIFKLHPVLFARVLYPLYLKISLRCTEPLKFRGGEIIALAKKATSRFQCNDFRSIVRADQIGKYHHALQRQKLLPSLASFKTSMQAGCTPGTGVDHVHLQLEAYSSWVASGKRSFCILFLDVASAYYKAVRSFIVEGDFSDEAVAHLFHINGWQPALLHEFLSALPSKLPQLSNKPRFPSTCNFRCVHVCSLRGSPWSTCQVPSPRQRKVPDLAIH